MSEAGAAAMGPYHANGVWNHWLKVGTRMGKSVNLCWTFLVVICICTYDNGNHVDELTNCPTVLPKYLQKRSNSKATVRETSLGGAYSRIEGTKKDSMIINVESRPQREIGGVCRVEEDPDEAALDAQRRADEDASRGETAGGGAQIHQHSTHARQTQVAHH